MLTFSINKHEIMGQEINEGDYAVISGYYLDGERAQWQGTFTGATNAGQTTMYYFSHPIAGSFTLTESMLEKNMTGVSIKVHPVSTV